MRYRKPPCTILQEQNSLRGARGQARIQRLARGPGALVEMIVLSVLSSEGEWMGPCGKGPKWAIKRTLIVVGQKGFHRERSEKESQPCVIAVS